MLCTQCVGDDGDDHVGEVALEEPQWNPYRDDLNGQELRKDLVVVARAEELAVVIKMQVWRKARREECFQATGRPPITLRWVDTTKGDKRHPKYRLRIVAKEIKIDNLPELLPRPHPWSSSSTSSRDAPAANEGGGPANL